VQDGLGDACGTKGACGFHDNVFKVFTSPTAGGGAHPWSLANGDLLPELMHARRVEWDEPNVGYNVLRKRYLMTMLSAGRHSFADSKVATAESDSPLGPFVFVEPLVMQGATVLSDTVSLFVDFDNTAYISYDTRDAPCRHVLERLTPDWRNSTGDFAVVWSKPDFYWFDGGATWQRNGIYYTTMGNDCCFCPWGSDLVVFSAPRALGPWTPMPQFELNPCADGHPFDASPAEPLRHLSNPCDYNGTQPLVTFVPSPRGSPRADAPPRTRTHSWPPNPPHATGSACPSSSSRSRSCRWRATILRSSSGARPGTPIQSALQSPPLPTTGPALPA